MRNKYFIIVAFFVAVATIIGCTKSGEYRYKPTAKFDFASSGSKYVTTDITVSPKDSLYFQWTVTSSNQVKRVIALKNTTLLDTTFIPFASANSYSTTKKYIADSIPGVYSYIFTAYDSTGYKLGTKSITVTVTSDYDYFVNRVLFVPDTTAKTNKTYFSAINGKTFSYTEGAANSASIDFGYYYDTTTANKHTIYAPSANPISFYNTSSGWTLNGTIFKKVTTVTMASLSSSGALRSAGITNLASGTSTKITALTSGNVVLFKTAAGKYGAISVNYLSAASPSVTTYMTLDVKIQR